MKDEDTPPLMIRYDIPAVVSGVIYGSGMFAVGFLLGVGRILWLEPKVGEVQAVLIEIPLMLLFCWYLSTRCVLAWYCCQVCLAFTEECTNINALGISAFTSLCLMESFFSVALFHKTLGELEDDFTSTKGSIGVAAQILASSFPMIQLAMQEHACAKAERICQCKKNK